MLIHVGDPTLTKHITNLPYISGDKPYLTEVDLYD